MKRRSLIRGAGGLLAVSVLPLAFAQDGPEPDPEAGDSAMPTNDLTTGLTIEDWQRLLPPERFEILFRDKTERAWTSALNDEKRAGTYICAACYSPLFASVDKFDSGTGWPSFTQPISPEAIGTKRDFKLIWPRTEYHCATCGGHQGHVFDDGPVPTGQRWCNNGLALQFIADGEEFPQRRG